MDDRLLLYDCAAAPSARRARMFIAEKGRSIARMNIDLRARAHLAPEYLAINPAGMVPALRTVEGEIITENDGIAAYLEALWPDPGPTPFSRRSGIQLCRHHRHCVCRFCSQHQAHRPERVRRHP